MSVEIRRHNQRVVRDLEEGDMIEFKRGLYSHWAVYIGEETVVHLAGDDNDGLKDNIRPKSVFTICGKRFNKAFVKKDKFWTVAADSKAIKNNRHDGSMQPRPKRDIVAQALSMIGEIGYNLLWKNCEHFATFCRYGVEKSQQVRNFVKYSALGVAAGSLLVYMLGGDDEKK